VKPRDGSSLARGGRKDDRAHPPIALESLNTAFIWRPLTVRMNGGTEEGITAMSSRQSLATVSETAERTRVRTGGPLRPSRHNTDALIAATALSMFGAVAATLIVALVYFSLL
jgi:hypothetical protein